MAGRIPKAFIDDLIARSDVVEVVGRRVPLKRAGREYKACCPFHNEKSPSFHVNPQKGFYHCFGCGAHGDALRFVMEYDHCDFVTAIEILASEMGLSVPRENLSDAQLIKERQYKAEQLQGFSLLAQSAAWFSRNLREHVARAQAVSYLQGRGVTGAIARDFGVGFAPSDTDALQRAFPQVTTEQWLAVGLVSVREDGQVVDRFRGRVQFPIRDIKGRVVGFGGRIMQPSEFAPKYLNSPETEFFHKGQMLYGLYELLQSVRHIEHILVVEGYMDVVALAQNDIRNVVATLGTATSEEHLRLLFKYSKDVVFAFDGDKAGRQAAWKALPLALQQLTGDRGVRFFFLPDDEDPDSFVRRVGKAGFVSALSAALTAGQWLVQGLAMQTGLSWRRQEDVRRLLVQAVSLVKDVSDLPVQYALVQALAQAADMQEWQVEKLMGIRTGLAVNRRPEAKKQIANHDGLTKAQGLASRLLLLLSAYQQLSTDCLETDLSLLRQFGERGVVPLLNALHPESSRVLAVESVSRDVALSFEEAQTEWQDGWRRLVCQTVENARRSLLKMTEGGAMNEEQKMQLRQLSDRLRECRK
jgi:DNA primase